MNNENKEYRKISFDELDSDDVVLDRKREWFQYQYEPFEFDDMVDNWWIVETKCFDNTMRLNINRDFRLVEFIHLSPDTFFSEERDNYHNNSVMKWEIIQSGVDIVWNTLPFKGYKPTYKVEVENVVSLSNGSYGMLKEYKDVIENPYKVINHSTIKSLELMDRGLSEWKMKCMWEGKKPKFGVSELV